MAGDAEPSNPVSPGLFFFLYALAKSFIYIFLPKIPLVSFITPHDDYEQELGFEIGLQLCRLSGLRKLNTLRNIFLKALDGNCEEFFLEVVNQGKGIRGFGDSVGLFDN